MKHILLLFLGIFFLILGLIGLLIPVVPQVPFLAAGVFFLAGASPGFRQKVRSSKLYQKHVKEQVKGHRFLEIFTKVLDDDG